MGTAAASPTACSLLRVLRLVAVRISIAAAADIDTRIYIRRGTFVWTGHVMYICMYTCALKFYNCNVRIHSCRMQLALVLVAIAIAREN